LIKIRILDLMYVINTVGWAHNGHLLKKTSAIVIPCAYIYPLSILIICTIPIALGYVCYGNLVCMSGLLQTFCVSASLSTLYLLDKDLVDTFLREKCKQQLDICWNRHFLCRPCLVKGDYAVLSVHSIIIDR
jgi:hypothetical protein